MDEGMAEVEVSENISPQQVTVEEAKPTDESVPPKLGYFSEEQKKELTAKGCKIYQFDSPQPDEVESFNAKIRNKIVHFTAGVLKEDELSTFVTQWPRDCEIAVIPDHHLEGSNYPVSDDTEMKPLRKAQLALLARRDEYAQKYAGANATIGSAPLYMALESKEKELTGKSLFDKQIIRTSTTTRLKNNLNQEVERSYAFFFGDLVDRIDSGYGDNDMFVVPVLTVNSQN